MPHAMHVGTTLLGKLVPKQKDLQDKPPPLHSPSLGKMPKEPMAADICHSQPSGPLASRKLVQQSPNEQHPARLWAGSRAGHGAHWGWQVAQVRNTGTVCQTSPRAGRPSSCGHRLPSSETGRPGHSPQRHSSRSSSGPDWLSTGRANQQRGTGVLSSTAWAAQRGPGEQVSRTSPQASFSQGPLLSATAA